MCVRHREVKGVTENSFLLACVCFLVYMCTVVVGGFLCYFETILLLNYTLSAILSMVISVLVM